MKVEYDPRADAAYIYLVDIPPGGIAQTYPCDPHEVAAGIFLDFDSSDRLVGIDVQAASRNLPEEVLKRAEILGGQG